MGKPVSRSLKDVRVPGDYGLNSENYQCLNRFITLFDELRQLAVFNSYLTKTEALETLYHLAQYTIFQAQKQRANSNFWSFGGIWVRI